MGTRLFLKSCKRNALLKNSKIQNFFELPAFIFLPFEENGIVMLGMDFLVSQFLAIKIIVFCKNPFILIENINTL